VCVVLPAEGDSIVVEGDETMVGDGDTVSVASQIRLGGRTKQRVKTLPPMPDKMYLLRFKGTDLVPDFVIAASVEFHGEHMVFLKSDGTTAALCVLEIVESWSEIEL
jgi:hypothetical protein